MKHNTWVKSVIVSSFKSQLVSVIPFLENYLVLCVQRATSENYSALNNVSLNEFECPDFIVFILINASPRTTI